MKVTVNHNFTLTGHSGALYALLLLDQYLLSAGSDRMIVKWNKNEISEGEVIVKASGAVYSLYRMNENHLLAGQASGGIHVIDISARKEIKLLQLHNAPVFSIHSNQQYIFSLGGDGLINILDHGLSLIRKIRISEGKLRCMINYENVGLIGCSDGRIALLDLHTLEILKYIQVHQDGFGVNAITIDKKNNTLISGSRDAHLNIYNLPAMELIRSLPAHRAAIYDIAFHDSGKIFATASRDKTIKIWDAVTCEVLARIDGDNMGHNYSVNKLLWAGDSLFSCSDDRTVKSMNIIHR